jgi:hypothetical protein
MIEITVTMGVILLVLATKKKPVFGQMTLTGDLALDWIKSGIENVVEVSKIEFGSAKLFAENYNIPEYHQDKGVVALLYPTSEWGNPVLVTQKSILKPLEAQCVVWEESGAKVTNVKSQLGYIGRIEFDENCPKITMFKDKKAKQFAPYEVKID